MSSPINNILPQTTSSDQPSCCRELDASEGSPIHSIHTGIALPSGLPPSRLLPKPQLPLLEMFSAMPNQFWFKLQASNRAKPDTAPFALILHAEHDHNKALSSSANRADILTIAKTHCVALKVIGDREKVREKLQETKQQRNRPIDLLMISGHGRSDGITFGNGLEKKSIYSIQDIRKEDFDAMNPMGKIILNACNVGQALASQLATITELDVIASLNTVDQTKIIYSCSQHGLEMAATRDGQQYIRVFRKGKEAETPCIENPSYIEKAAYIKKDAERGNVLSQYTLGLLYKDGLGVKLSYEHALYWAKLAADAGRTDAQLFAGALSPSDTETEKYYLLAANALLINANIELLKKVFNRLGSLYGNWRDNNGAFAPRYKDALLFYLKAQNLGCFSSALLLGKMILLGQGCTASREVAKKIFLNIQKNGPRDLAEYATRNLNLIELLERNQ